MTEVEALYQRVDAAIEQGDYDEVAELCDELIAADANDRTAIECKVVALVNIGGTDAYKEALGLLEKHGDVASARGLEHAYCMYRLNEMDSAKAKVSEGDTLGHQLLRAQIAHRSGAYGEAVTLLRGVLDTHDGQLNETEVWTNLGASYLLDGQADAWLGMGDEMPELTYELLYNQACALIDLARFPEANKLLADAAELCRDVLEADDYTADEIADELAVIDAQRAYILQLEGRAEEARALYERVAKSKPSDSTVRAVVGNNMTAIHGTHGLFDSSRKNAKFRDDAMLLAKLTPHQRRVLTFNHLLLLFHMKKSDLCRAEAEQMVHALPDEPFPALVLAAVHHRNQKWAPRNAVLEKAAAHGHDAVTLTRAHLKLLEKKVVEAAELLGSIDALRNQPATVATLVALYERAGDVDAANRVINAAVAATPDPTDAMDADEAGQSVYVRLMRYASGFKMKHGLHTEAVDILEKLVRSTHDPESIVQLITAAAEVDVEKAREYGDMLPKMDMPLHDVDALEGADAPRVRPAYAKLEASTAKAVAQAQANDEAAPEEVTEARKRKKRRKKRVRLPKNYDPSVKPDPERWIPLRDRSYYKRRRGRHQKVSGGSQGSAPARPMEEPQAQVAPQQGQPQQAQGQNQNQNQNQKKKQQQNKKKKKRRGRR